MLALVALATVLVGCAAVNDILKTTSESEIALRGAVAEAVGDDPDKAYEVIEAVEAIEARLDGNPHITVADFYEQGSALINEHLDSPGLRVMALQYFRRAEHRLTERVEAGEIPEDEVMYIRKILDIGRDQAESELARLE